MKCSKTEGFEFKTFAQDKNLDMTKLKAFVENTLYVVQMIIWLQ